MARRFDEKYAMELEDRLKHLENRKLEKKDLPLKMIRQAACRGF